MNIGGGSKVAGGLGALAAGVNAFRIAIDLKQSMGEAGAQLMEEYMNATGGPGGYVQTTANQAGYVWDPNATSDTPGFIEPGKNFRLSTGEYLYYTNEFDVSLQLGIVDLERPLKIASTRKVKNWLTELSLSDVGHFALDILGTLPIVGPAADLIHAGWYFFEGDYKNAALSAAASIGGSSFLLTSKYGSKTNSFAAKISDEVAEGTPKVGSIFVDASSAASKAADDVGSIFIKNKHLSNATGGYAKFATTDISTAQGWVQQALRSPNAQFMPNPQIPDTFQVVTDLGKAIGTKGQTTIRIIVGFDGTVINAFPVK